MEGAAIMTIGNEVNNRLTADEPPEGSWWTKFH